MTALLGPLLTLALVLHIGAAVGEAQSARMVRVGFLSSTSAAAAGGRVDALRAGLRELGYVEGQNLRIEYRWADGDDARLPALAGELVRLGVDVIVTQGTPPTLAAKRGTEKIPIVFVGAGDAVAARLVNSLREPGVNVTGLTSIAPDLAAKRLELLKQAMPDVRRVIVLANPTNTVSKTEVPHTTAAAHARGLAVDLREARDPAELAAAFAAMRPERGAAVVVLSDLMFFAQRALIRQLAVKNGLPLMAWTDEFVDAGALMSYGPNVVEMHRRAAVFVDRIVKGADPAKYPVEQPARFDLVVNLRNAGSLGLTLPRAVVLRADRVIQ